MTHKEPDISREQETQIQDIAWRRTFMVALVIAMGLVLVVGFAVVFGTIIYRLSTMQEETLPTVAGLVVPEGAEIVSVTLDDHVMGVLFDRDGKRHILLADWQNGRILRIIRVQKGGGEDFGFR